MTRKAAPSKPDRKPNGRLGDAVWAAMRDEYVTGNESYAEIAARYGVTKKAVQAHALDRAAPINDSRTWAEHRTEFRRRVSDETQEQTSAAAAETLAIVREKSANVAKLALEEIERRLTPRIEGEPVVIETRDLVQVAKLATTIKVELSGNPDQPVELRTKLDKLTLEELRALAESP